MPVTQGTFGKYCRMHLRPWINERHQTPKSDFLDFRFAASICTLSGLGLSKDIERAPAANLKCALLSSRIQAQSRLRDLVQNVMAITDGRSRFWWVAAVETRPHPQRSRSLRPSR